MYTAKKKIAKVSLTHEEHIRQLLTGECITFDDEDAYGLFISHNDVLVIFLVVHDTNVK